MLNDLLAGEYEVCPKLNVAVTFGLTGDTAIVKNKSEEKEKDQN